MKKFLVLLLATLVGGLSACNTTSPGSSGSLGSSVVSSTVSSESSSSSSSVDAPEWHPQLQQMMITYLGELLPCIQLSEPYNFSYDEIYKEILILDVSGANFSDQMALALGGAGYLNTGTTSYPHYVKGDIYVEFGIEPTTLCFMIIAGTALKPLTSWDENLTKIMNDNYGIVIPVPETMSDKISYSFDEEKCELLIYDPYTTMGDYFYTLLDQGFTYLDSVFTLDYLYIKTDKYDDKVILVAVGISEAYLLMGLYDIPDKIEEWNPDLISLLDYYFDVELPLIELSTYYGVSLNTIDKEIIIVDPFAVDLSADLGAKLEGLGYSTDGIVSDEGLVTYARLDGAYIRFGFDRTVGFIIFIGSTLAPVELTQWHQETSDLMVEKYGMTIPVAPVTTTYDFGVGTNGEVYISDFRCGDIFDEYASLLVNSYGYEFVRRESDGFYRYDGAVLTIHLQYFADRDVFEIWISKKPGPITQWSQQLSDLMLYRLGATIPVAPLYSDAMSSFNAAMGFVFILDSSALDVRDEYAQILLANGYQLVDASDPTKGYQNLADGIIIEMFYYEGAGMEIHVTPIAGPRPTTTWDPLNAAVMVDTLGEEIPFAGVTNFYFGFADYDYENYNPLIAVYDTYCDSDIATNYALTLTADPDYQLVDNADAMTFLAEEYPVSHYQFSVGSTPITFYANEDILIAFGYDSEGEYLGSPSFVLVAFMRDPVPVEVDNGGTIEL